MNPIKFGSYNVEQFGKLAGKDKSASERASDKAARISALRQTLNELDVDVLSLQEVTSAEELAQVLDTDALKKKFPHTTFLPTDSSPWEVNAAVLSRYPITGSAVQREQELPDPSSNSPGRGYSFVRGLGIVDIEVAGIPTRTYVHHGKADPWYGAADQPNYEIKRAKAAAHRGREMQAIEKIVLNNAKAFPAQLQVVTGDFNTIETSGEMTRLLAGPLFDPLAGQDQISHPATEQRMDYVLLDESGIGKSAVGHVHDSPAARLASDHLPVVLSIDPEA